MALSTTTKSVRPILREIPGGQMKSMVSPPWQAQHLLPQQPHPHRKEVLPGLIIQRVKMVIESRRARLTIYTILKLQSLARIQPRTPIRVSMKEPNTTIECELTMRL